MAVRPTMDYLIQYVRDLIDDQEDADPYFTDQHIQDRLDLNRRDLYMHELTPADTLVAGGKIEYHSFHSRWPFWETDVVLQNPQGTALTPTTSDTLTGHWYFSTAQTTLPVYLTGKRYDVYGACASLLTNLISRLRHEFNFTADGMTIQRIQQVRDLRDQAAEFKRMSWGSGNATTIKLTRKDVRG